MSISKRDELFCGSGSNKKNQVQELPFRMESF